MAALIEAYVAQGEDQTVLKDNYTLLLQQVEALQAENAALRQHSQHCAPANAEAEKEAEEEVEEEAK